MAIAATTAATATTAPPVSTVHDKIAKGPGLIGTLIFVGVLVIGIGYIALNS